MKINQEELNCDECWGWSPAICGINCPHSSSGKGEDMIVATPDGKYYAEIWPETNGYKKIMKRIPREVVVHYCDLSADYVVHRPLTFWERFRVREEPRE